MGAKFFSEQDRLHGALAPELCPSQYSARVGSGRPMDRAGHSDFGRTFYAAFPDLRHEIEQVVVEGDVVVVRFTLQGTQTGAFFGIPASNRKVVVPAQVLLTVREGKVASLLGVFDEAGLLRQLGVLPSG